MFAVGKREEGTTRIRTRIHGLIIECDVDAEVRRKREEGRRQSTVNSQQSTVNSYQ
ncbi:hypothetical protein [Microcoleus sp. D2_18a_D3]|uniref:hypothetical protein n=1 Tax=Microcoleus sp. D2_18a_D3 TaxID=3055330 RepID=UPI002FD6E1E1